MCMSQLSNIFIILILTNIILELTCFDQTSKHVVSKVVMSKVSFGSVFCKLNRSCGNDSEQNDIHNFIV